MKQLSLVNKIIFLLNIVAALLLLISYAGSYISVKTFPFFSLLNLAIPLLVLINTIFVLYWVFALKKQVLFSLGVLFLGYFVIDGFYKKNNEISDANQDELKILSFNVRGFNEYDLLNNKEAGNEIIDLIKRENPDIVCLQEHSRIWYKELKMYSYRAETPYSTRRQVTQVVFSKYPIIKKGSLDFPETSNNGIYADILYEKDTVRVYNLHLQSFKVIPSVGAVMNEPKDRLYNRMAKSFAKQEEQANLFLEHSKTISYRKIVCGDINNNQYSKIYRTIKGDMLDTFEERGNGFGRTYDFMGYPLRIDFILADPEFEIIDHKNYNEKLSDHYPVMAKLKLESH